MNVKTIVKVMNFHALLRVEASRRLAEMHGAMQDELAAMMRIVLNNRNLRLDKRVRLPDPNAPVLRIYMGSDLGFCGSVNAAVSTVIRQDGTRTEKVVIGKKLRRPPEVSLFLSQEEYQKNFSAVQAYLERAVRARPWSAVELVYNHYYNFSSIKQVVRRIYPLEAQDEEQGQWDDFTTEDDLETLLEDMTISYMVYELRLAADSAYAAENVMRQNATSESLKKLDEMEIDESRRVRKEKNQAAFQKTIDSFTRQKALEDA